MYGKFTYYIHYIFIYQQMKGEKQTKYNLYKMKKFKIMYSTFSKYLNSA
jgi:hypothetical protein